MHESLVQSPVGGKKKEKKSRFPRVMDTEWCIYLFPKRGDSRPNPLWTSFLVFAILLHQTPASMESELFLRKKKKLYFTYQARISTHITAMQENVWCLFPGLPMVLLLCIWDGSALRAHPKLDPDIISGGRRGRQTSPWAGSNSELSTHFCFWLVYFQIHNRYKNALQRVKKSWKL